MSLEVEVVGLKDLVSDFKRAGGDATRLVQAAVLNSTSRTQHNIRTQAPHRTGALQQRVLMSVTATTGIVHADEKYAEYVEYGTKPHIITPKNKKALYWKGAFSPVKLVHHPGTKANPFFRRGVDQSKAYIKEQFDKVMDRILKELAGRA